MSRTNPSSMDFFSQIRYNIIPVWLNLKVKKLHQIHSNLLKAQCFPRLVPVVTPVLVAPNTEPPIADVFAPKPEVLTPKAEVPKPELFGPNPEVPAPNPEVLVPKADVLVPKADVLAPKAEVFAPKAGTCCPSVCVGGPCTLCV